MEMFLSNAFRYLKGQSGQPSVLPDKDSVDKEMPRKVRLFCKGLKCFREILYKDEEPVKERASNQQPRNAIVAGKEDLFQSMFAAKETPPGSPGSATSSSTLINPQSRKVSPLSVKDFADASDDSKHVLDPMVVVEENTKKELVKQLKKKTAAEEKASQKVKELAARNVTLNAKLESAAATVQNRDAQTDLAKTYANAMKLSNVVLRQMVQDSSRELSHEKNGAQPHGTRSEEEGTWNQQKEKALKDHLGQGDEFGASAYGRIPRLENASAELDQGLDDVDGQGTIPTAYRALLGDGVELNESEFATVALPYRKASEKPQAAFVEPNSFIGTTGETQPEAKMEGSEDMPKKKTGGVGEKDGVSPVWLWGILNPVTPTAQKDSEKEDTEEASCGEEAHNEVKEHPPESIVEEEKKEDDQTEGEPIENGDSATEETEEQVEINVEWISSSPKPTEHALGKSQAMADSTDTSFEEASPEQDALSELNDKDQVFEAEDDTPPRTAGKDPAAQEHNADATPSPAHAQCVSVGCAGGITGNPEFSEPPGPATLWGILDSDQSEHKEEDDSIPRISKTEKRRLERKRAAARKAEEAAAKRREKEWAEMV